MGRQALASVIVLIALGTQALAGDSEDCGGASAGSLRIAACTRIIEDGTQSPGSRTTAYRNRANTWMDSGDNDRAMADYDNAIALDPNDADAYNDRGLIWLDKGENNSAINDFDRAIELDPGKASAYYNRGLAWAHKGDNARAIVDYSRAIELNPTYMQAYNNRGFVLNRRGQFDRAIADFDKAISLDPKHPFAYNNRAISWGAKGDAERAMADYSQAITLNPTYVNPYGSRGIYYFYDGDVAKAQADFAAAAELAPHNAYFAIWADLAERHGGGIGHLRQATNKLDMTSWPAPLVRMFLGEQTPEAVLASADDSPPGTKRGNLCDANLYIAEFHWLKGRTDKALPYYQRAANDCPHDFIEYVAAGKRLHALGVSP
ncbi:MULTISPECIES: tetratricopeptide repeat protein [unclassified Mesorhizobium]|uniref:tetratricopeptide repeat protein n=1 Tax=unclassified Mesorhizobium TaxID=325217 RepID=UPI000FCBF394|nr:MULTISPECIES: tetratricopeptide repeat protein [unclassified Mesorhizobium]RUW28025.1 tetratricopeptide repeat protein [Mesorhizobium sp. M1E.F.Ca.ET.041.01.1.1]RWD80390.1 MAG: tetratricopeptide repeat protein [Mesorhizobium sp.]RWD94999.1 MAG: tetratricopeptide repeat protein [Mesorhizobium sp.]TIV50687.1 MAG: tetratricopeptide repeat protein [Mesorhizobium sp.]